MKKSKKEAILNKILASKEKNTSLSEKLFSKEEAKNAKNSQTKCNVLSSLFTIFAIGLIVGNILTFNSILNLVTIILTLGIAGCNVPLILNQLKETKSFGKKYDLSLNETFNALYNKELFEALSKNNEIQPLNAKKVEKIEETKQIEPSPEIEKVKVEKQTKTETKQLEEENEEEEEKQ